jgi:hypothetical protein
MKKYTWIASSNDGSYQATSCRFFDTKKEAYEDMRNEALEKMKWNTELEDFSDLDESDYLGYEVKFHPNYIVHESYSGTYTYKMVSVHEKVCLHDREWEVIDSFTPRKGYDWEVCLIHGVGAIWMNNVEGYIVLIEESNRILKSDI